MKINNFKKIISLAVTFLSFPFLSSAQTIQNYIPISGDNSIQSLGLQGTTNNLGAFLGAVYNVGIAAAVALTVIMLIWGGIEKMTTESYTGKSKANERMKNAVYGLILALTSYVILYIINPCLVQFVGNGCNNALLKGSSGSSNTSGGTSSNVPSTTEFGGYNEPVNNSQVTVGSFVNTGTNGGTSVGGSGSGVTSGSVNLLSDSSAKNLLSIAAITVQNPATCSVGTSSPCISLEGLPQNAVDGLIAAQNYCNNNYGAGCIAVIGGTEQGHQAVGGQGSGYATVDINYSDNAKNALINADGLTESQNFGGGTSRGIFTCEPQENGTTAISCEASGAKVIHIQF